MMSQTIKKYTRMERLLNILRFAVAFTILTVGGMLAFAIWLLSLGKFVDFNRRTVVPFYSKMILWVLRIKLENQLDFNSFEKPVFITFNHNSFLDGMVLMSLGFTRTHFLLSEKMYLYLPLFFTSWATGVWYIPTKSNRARRLNYFKKIEQRILSRRVSVAGSSEGARPHFHGIAEFNRGVYHMACNCQMPVVALYIHTPEESNPFSNFRPFKRGVVQVSLLGTFETENWNLNDLDQHVQAMQNVYINEFNRQNNISN
jgi:1-acyl-sn-glycerol-3-phosphate acyltransferase